MRKLQYRATDGGEEVVVGKGAVVEGMAAALQIHHAGARLGKLAAHGLDTAVERQQGVGARIAQAAVEQCDHRRLTGLGSLAVDGHALYGILDHGVGKAAVMRGVGEEKPEPLI